MHLTTKMCADAILRGEDPHWLYTQYQQGTNLLLIDCRPYSEYAKGHIEGAINISVPSSLMLRRLIKGNVPIKNFINSDASKQKYDDRGLFEKIVLYDDSSLTENGHDNNLLSYLCGKALQDHSVCILSGELNYH